MEKAIINQIQPLIPQIVMLSKKHQTVSLDYDKQADVLYVSFEKPQQATDTEIVSDHLLLRKRDRQLVGYTILHASQFMN